MGKNALEAPRSNLFNLEPETLFLITDEKNPLYDPRVNLPVEDTLVQNIMYQGIIEPVVVTKQDDKVVVVAGRQRVRAAIEANKRLKEMGKETLRVPCVVRRGDDTALFGVSVSENEQRRDDSPLAKAEKLQRYLNMGKSEEEATVVFGVTVQSVHNWLKLLELSAAVKKAVDTGKISANAAVQFHGLDREAQEAGLAELLSKEKPTGNTARRIAKGEEKTTKEIKDNLRKKLVKAVRKFGADAVQKLLDDAKKIIEDEEAAKE
jgi:ParB family chromosome partitioning protein